MTVREMIWKRPNRSSVPPASIFEVKEPSGELRLLCWASFGFPVELADMVSKHPDLLEWEVTKEDFTQEEMDAWKPSSKCST